jgi:hypothetical protein
MGLHLSVLKQLQASSSWPKYQTLVAAADASAHDSAAHWAKAHFEQAWQSNPARAEAEGVPDWYVPRVAKVRQSAMVAALQLTSMR